MIALGVIARAVSVGRGSPRRGSRKRETEINRAHTKPTTRNPVVQTHYIYETPEILRSIFSTDFCLQSDNGVSTSNSPPPRNIVIDYSDYNIETYSPKYQHTVEGPF